MKFQKKLVIGNIIIFLFIKYSSGTYACSNTDSRCPSWANSRECYHNPIFMACKCSLSCQSALKCGDTNDTTCKCGDKALSGLCESNVAVKTTTCPSTCAMREEIECAAPPNINHAHHVGLGRKFMDRVKYVCDSGYEKKLATAFGTQVCTENGRWVQRSMKEEGKFPVCLPISCGQPPSLNNTNMSYSGTSFGDEVKYQCLDGYYKRMGDEMRICRALKKWGGEDLICKAISCGQPSSLNNTNMSYSGTSFGDDVKYQCLDGYYKTAGDERRICTPLKKWDGEDLICNSISCGQPPSLSNTNMSYSGTSFGDDAIYQCLDGYHKTAGDEMRICTAIKEWGGEDLICNETQSIRPTSLVDDSLQSNSWDQLRRFTDIPSTYSSSSIADLPITLTEISVSGIFGLSDIATDSDISMDGLLTTRYEDFSTYSDITVTQLWTSSSTGTELALQTVSDNYPQHSIVPSSVTETSVWNTQLQFASSEELSLTYGTIMGSSTWNTQWYTESASDPFSSTETNFGKSSGDSDLSANNVVDYTISSDLSSTVLAIPSQGTLIDSLLTTMEYNLKTEMAGAMSTLSSGYPVKTFSPDVRSSELLSTTKPLCKCRCSRTTGITYSSMSFEAIMNLTPTIKKFSPKPVEAPGAVYLGVSAIIILASTLGVIILLDLVTVCHQFNILRHNLNCVKEGEQLSEKELWKR